MASPALEHANTVGWYILEGYPWWPVYICDQFKLRPNLYSLGDGHKRILKKAKDFKNDYALVYYFGSHDFSLVKLNKGILKPWECSEKEMYLKGHPKHLMKKGTVSDELKFAIQEVEDYLSQPEDIRLPPHMVPSDLDPTLEPPPPMERPEEEDEDGGEDEDDAMASDADGGADEEEDAEEDREEEDEDEDGAKKKKTAKKKTAPKKEKKEKEKKAKEKKEPKHKKEKKEKEKKPPKEKKAAALKDKKEKKEKEKKKPEDTDKPKETPPTKLKRQRSSGSLNGEATAGGSAAKQAKKDKSGDVKAAANGAASDSEEIAVVLEREIRWVLSNAQYEELTTKMLRKVLEERLQRDLKQYRDTIKAVVARVIDEEEDAPVDGAAEAETTDVVKKDEFSDDVVMKDAETVEEVPVKSESALEPVKAEKVEKVESPEEEPVKKEDEVVSAQPTQAELTAKQLQDAAAELAVVALDDERKILDILKSLKKLSDVTTAQLSDSGLLPKLVELCVHRKRSVSSAVGELATQWDTEDAIPPPKPVEEKDIVPLKEKLTNPETSHDELLATIMELHNMSLEMSHLKSTGIARVVADLRQHANDKVSIAAKNLRNAWMQLAEKGKQPRQLKKLEKLNEILESEKESEETKLGVLHKLLKLSLTTQEIIESKIGVMVSKLRKSSNDQVVQAALKLRKKWKSEAASS